MDISHAKTNKSNAAPTRMHFAFRKGIMLIALLVAMGSLSSSSCSDDDDDDTSAESGSYTELIVGTWYSSVAESELVFYSNGNFEVTEEDETDTGTWSIDEDQLTLKYDEDDEDEEGLEDVVATILTLNSKTLTLSWYDQEDDDTIYVTYTRQ